MNDQPGSNIINLYVARRTRVRGVSRSGSFAKLSNSRAIACRDAGNEREQGRGSVTGVSRLDLDHFDSQLDSPRLMQRFLNFRSPKSR